MARTIVRLFDNRAEAMAAVDDLERAGVRSEDIGVVSSNRENWFDSHQKDRKHGRKDADRDGKDDRAEGATTGATTGGAIGAGAGLLAGLGLLAIPGLGPVVAAGWLASTATGLAAGAVAGGMVGGLVGALTKEGVPENEAHVYSEGVKRGGTLVTVRVHDDRLSQIENTLDRRGGHVNVQDREQEYRRGGWSRFDDTLPPM